MSSLPPLRLHAFFSNAHLPHKRFGLIQTRGERMIHPHPRKSLISFYFFSQKKQNKTKPTHKYTALPACLDSYETSLRITEPNTSTGSIPDSKASPPNSVPSHVKYMKELHFALTEALFFLIAILITSWVHRAPVSGERSSNGWRAPSSPGRALGQGDRQAPHSHLHPKSWVLSKFVGTQV